MSEIETLDNILKDLVHTTKLIKPLKFTPEKVKDLLRQFVAKHSISILSDILDQKRYIENRYNIDRLNDDNLIELIFKSLIKIIEKYSEDKVKVWSVECNSCGFIWEDIIYKLPHDAICPSCRMKNATLTKIKDSENSQVIKPLGDIPPKLK